jgi:CAAX protease family protein
MADVPSDGMATRGGSQLLPHIPWVLPFAVFMLLLGLMPRLGLHPAADQAVRLAIVGGVLLAVSRPVIDWRIQRWMASVAVGLLVFVLWILPDLLIPTWHDGVIFNNKIVGRPHGHFPAEGQTQPLALSLRFLRAAVLVPIVEELFWRGWLPRVVLNPDFRRVPLGSYTPAVFVITALLFATEHGSWWDVGLMAGLVYNWWMFRTRSLADCILAHAVTNACLSAYVISAGKWQYW